MVVERVAAVRAGMGGVRSSGAPALHIAVLDAPRQCSRGRTAAAAPSTRHAPLARLADILASARSRAASPSSWPLPRAPRAPARPSPPRMNRGPSAAGGRRECAWLDALRRLLQRARSCCELRHGVPQARSAFQSASLPWSSAQHHRRASCRTSSAASSMMAWHDHVESSSWCCWWRVEAGVWARRPGAESPGAPPRAAREKATAAADPAPRRPSGAQWAASAVPVVVAAVEVVGAATAAA